MQAIYATDLHGDIKKYEELKNVCLENKIDTLILGGNLFPSGKHRIEKQLKFIEILDNMFYWFQEETDVRIVLIKGNDDLELYDKEFEQVVSNYAVVTDVSNDCLIAEDYRIIGMPNIGDHPFPFKDRVVIDDTIYSSKGIVLAPDGRYKKVNNWSEFAIRNLNSMKQVLEGLPEEDARYKDILLFHQVPTGLDLDKDIYGKSIGSNQIRDFIIERNPYVSLHGHAHDSYDKTGVWKNKIKQTPIIQPGQYEQGSEYLRYVIADFDTNSYEKRKRLVR